MWEWIMETLNMLVKSNDINSIKAHFETDDVKSEVFVILLKDRELADKIYKKKNISYLNTLVKRVIYEMKSKYHFKNKEEFSRFQRINFVCEKYGIDMTPANAYKISHMMEYENYSTTEFSITLVAQILKEYKESEIFIREELIQGDVND